MDKEKQRQPSLTLHVMNGNELESGRAAQCLFREEGGDIGHAQTCHWSVQDRRGSVAARACQVIRHDGAFCIKSLEPGLTINLAQISPQADLVRLRHGDEISLGALSLRVFLHEGQRISYEEQMALPESIVTNRDSLTGGLPGISADPLHVLQAETLTASLSTASHQQSATHTEKGGIDFSFMDLPSAHASPRDDADGDSSELSQRHLAITPLLRGLGCTLTLHNSQEADEFLEEAGRTLHAAIEGLLDLQHQQNSLSDKHLRPLEDNPLRLNLDYDTALSVMFADEKSPVHLAAPAAVAESLRNIQHHEQANQAAIVEALRIMLDAFSPASLMRRFAQYRRSHEQRQTMDEAWAWRMYRNYYGELASGRQQGFEMLFNEVYAQVYDRVLREKQQESEA